MYHGRYGGAVFAGWQSSGMSLGNPTCINGSTDCGGGDQAWPSTENVVSGMVCDDQADGWTKSCTSPIFGMLHDGAWDDGGVARRSWAQSGTPPRDDESSPHTRPVTGTHHHDAVCG